MSVALRVCPACARAAKTSAESRREDIQLRMVFQYGIRNTQYGILFRIAYSVSHWSLAVLSRHLHYHNRNIVRSPALAGEGDQRFYGRLRRMGQNRLENFVVLHHIALAIRA